MNRRTFLRDAGLGLAALSGACSSLGRTPRPTPKNWIWTGVNADASADEQERRFAGLRESGIRAVLFSGTSERVFSIARKHGLETHAWIWTLCRGDRFIADNHPEWYCVSRNGDSTLTKPPYVGYYKFLCPSREGVQEYLAKVVSDLGDHAELDGIHLDYIRYPDVILPRALWEKYGLVQTEELPQFDFCYCDVCCDAFKQTAGVDPLQLPDPPADAPWRRFRHDSVTRLVNRLAAVARSRHKKITAAVFPTPTLARKLVRQDWVRWNLDAVLPMVYHSFYNQDVAWIREAVREGVDALPKSRPLFAGLYLPALKEEQEFDAAVKHALAGGARGVSLFGGLRRIKTGRHSE